MGTTMYVVLWALGVFQLIQTFKLPEETKGFTSLIMNGDLAKHKDFPFVVALVIAQNFTIPNCAGVLINKQHVVTAASCVANWRSPTNSTATMGYVLLGATNMLERETGHKIVKIADIEIHSEFNIWNGAFNVAVVKLAEPVNESDSIKTIYVADADSNLDNKTVTVLGWGFVNQTMLSTKLRKVDLDIITQAACKAQYMLLHHATHLCTSTKGKGACLGDGGGPMIIKDTNNKWVVAGLVGYTAPCTANGRRQPERNVRLTYKKIYEFIEDIAF